MSIDADIPRAARQTGHRSVRRSILVSTWWWVVVCATLLVLAVRPAAAQDEAARGGGLNPYPPGDVYNMVVVGDWLAEGLGGGLADALSSEARVAVSRKAKPLESLMRGEFDDQLKNLDEALKREPAGIAVVMLGTQDRVSLRAPNGRRFAVGSDEWRAEFGKRVETVVRMFRKHGTAVYWVGLPTLRRQDANEDAQMINAIIRERGFVAGGRYIDAFAGFADEEGEYSIRGPDIAGQMKQLRSSDGVGFTMSGYRKLAHFVERELRRDLNQARADRIIPLAGDEKEQASIAAAKGNTPDAASAAQPAPDKGMSAMATKGGEAAGDLKADNGRINFKMPAQDGREDVVAIEILRPALAASVVSLVTRKESQDRPAQMGDSIADASPGGLTLLSSITPASTAVGAGRRKLAPTQTPYFRVIVKGERLASRPGRVDDLVWPPPETVSSPEAAQAQGGVGAASPQEEGAAPQKSTPIRRGAGRQRD